MANVYFIPTEHTMSEEEVSDAAHQLLTLFVEKEAFVLEDNVPLKVHFGEKGNITYIKPGCYNGIIAFLQQQKVATSFIETSVLYAGERSEAIHHLQLAHEHGFTQVPVHFADGEQGEAFTEVVINKKYFKQCKIGEGFSRYKQLIVCSHFKGHAMAGFGGALKQLAMGCASKGGKMAMHLGEKPILKNRKCKRCNLCLQRCNYGAITIGEKSFIDHKKCVGCGACLPACPHKAITAMSLKGVLNALLEWNKLGEKIAEYALAAQLHKQHIYINFATSITKGCDCEPKKMKPILNDIGVFLSTDPVAIDKACLDKAKEHGKQFKGGKQLAYAEKIGLGSLAYTLVTCG